MPFLGVGVCLGELLIFNITLKFGKRFVFLAKMWYIVFSSTHKYGWLWLFIVRKRQDISVNPCFNCRSLVRLGFWTEIPELDI